MKGILGIKLGMTQVFTQDGRLIPVTVIKVEPNVVTQIKTVETDGYNSVQLGMVDKKESRANKANVGHAKKANTAPKRFLKEIRDFDTTYELGSILGADIFTAGEYVDVTGTSKGKGMQGSIKRHNFSRGPMTHGSRYHRGSGSLGTMRAMRVLKGKKLPGHMGAETTTIQNLEIIEVNPTEGYILVSGNVPGPKKSLVIIKTSIKDKPATAAKELVTYETTVEEIIETPVENSEENTTTETVVETEQTEEVKNEESTAVVEESVTEESTTESN